MGNGTWEDRYGDRDDATVAKLRAAYAPLKSFRTRSGLQFDIVEPGGQHRTRSRAARRAGRR